MAADSLDHHSWKHRDGCKSKIENLNSKYVYCQSQYYLVYRRYPSSRSVGTVCAHSVNFPLTKILPIDFLLQLTFLLGQNA